MDFKIAVLAGDGIGPEISAVGVDVMTAVCEKFGHNVSYKHAICGAHAIDEVGDPFPEETFQVCEEADAVLFSAVGDPKFDNDPTAKVRPEQGLLAMRKKLGLFANIRPVQTFKCLVHKSPLRAELVENADFICIRELTGGMYFGLYPWDFPGKNTEWVAWRRGLPDPGTETGSPASAALQADSLLLSHQGRLAMKNNILLSSKHLKTVPGT